MRSLRTANTRHRRAYRKAHKGIGPHRWKGQFRRLMQREGRRTNWGRGQSWREDKPLAPPRPESLQDGGPMHAVFLNTRRST